MTSPERVSDRALSEDLLARLDALGASVRAYGSQKNAETIEGAAERIRALEQRLADGVEAMVSPEQGEFVEAKWVELETGPTIRVEYATANGSVYGYSPTIEAAIKAAAERVTK